MVNFPTTLDSPPTAATLASHMLSTDPHSTLHGDLGLMIAALEAKVGVDSSAVATSIDYKLTHNFPLLSQLTTKGDIWSATASGVVTRLAAGADGLALVTDSTQATGLKWAAAAANQIYGDGSDGTQTLDGSTTILGMVPSGNIYTATRDLFLTALTINNGVTLEMANFRLFVLNTLTNNGTIRAVGTAGSNGVGGAGGAGGAAAAVGTLGGGTTGGAGGSAVSGSGGVASTTNGCIGAAGTVGGAAGANGGGPAGTASEPTAVMGGTPRALPMCIVLAVNTTTPAWWRLQGGTGGGGGGAQASSSGGGGGAGGGILLVVARLIAGTGTIHADGGAGGNAGGTNAGGGSGGGGGVVYVVSQSISAGAVTGQTIRANGGALGTKLGTGTNGTAGNNGSTVLVPG